MLNILNFSKETKQVSLYSLQGNFILLSKLAVEPKQHKMYARLPDKCWQNPLAKNTSI